MDRVLVHLDTKYERTMGSESFYVGMGSSPTRDETLPAV